MNTTNQEELKITNAYRKSGKNDIFTYQHWLIEYKGKKYSVRQFNNSKHNKYMKRVRAFEVFNFKTQIGYQYGALYKVIRAIKNGEI